MAHLHLVIDMGTTSLVAPQMTCGSHSRVTDLREYPASAVRRSHLLWLPPALDTAPCVKWGRSAKDTSISPLFLVVLTTLDISVHGGVSSY